MIRFAQRMGFPTGGGICRVVAAWLACVIGLQAAEVTSFQAGDGGWHMGTLAVGNLDNDAQLEIVVPYRNSSGQWFLDAFKANGTRLAGFPYAGGSSEINTSPTLYDLDGDGRDEILFTCGNRVVALRGDGTTLWSTAVTRANYIPTSGYMTVTNGFYWSNGGGFIPQLPATAVFSSQVSSPMVADVTGTGKKEIVTAWKIDPDSTGGHQDFNPFINDIWGSGEWGTVGESWSGGVVYFDAATGAKNYVYHLHQLVESGLALGHADTGAPWHTYVLNDSDSVVAFDKTKPHGLYGKGNLHKQFGKNQRLRSGSYQQGIDLFTADLDGDGLAEVLVPATQLNPLWQPNETILDDDGAVLWRKLIQPVGYPLNQWQNNAAMIPINPDHDNHVDVLSFSHGHEIAFRYWNGVELVDRPGWPKSFYPHLPTPPVVGDVDGDGQEEIVIGTYDPTKNPSDGSLYVYALDGTLKYSVTVPGGLKHIPSIANLRGLGLDVIYRSLAGRIFIQNFGSTSSGPVSWATHRGNRQRDGNLGAALFPAGTPLITGKQASFRSASFAWGGAATNTARAWRIYRAEQPAGPFTNLVTVAAGTTSYVDFLPRPGWQYVYEVAAVYETHEVRSAPFALNTSLNHNLVVNGGFEEDDHSHWDKWFTGSIDWTNMVASGGAAYEGRKAMAITFVNQGSNDSISQYNQYGTPDAYLAVTPGQLYSFGGFFKSDGLSQPSEHWLEWSSTKTAGDTSDRPLRPWPEYYTPHFVIGTQPTEWTYANRTFVMPAGFPNAEITARHTLAAAGSGTVYLDNVFFRPLPSPTATNWTELIPFGGLWRYSVVTPPAAWTTTNFSDALWPLGPAKFGAGSGPLGIATTLPAQLPAYYFRRTFVAPALPCEELLLSATCTEGAGKSLEIWLNGVPLLTTGIEAVSGQGNAVRYYDLTPFAGLLRPGSNTIAVTLNNVAQSGWDDVAFDVSLKVITYAPPSAAGIGSLTPAGSAMDVGLNLPAGTVWRVESTDGLWPPFWQLVDSFTNHASGTMWLRDSGQNERPAPNQAPTRFYRLVPE
jgi:hypothetical protein